MLFKWSEVHSNAQIQHLKAICHHKMMCNKIQACHKAPPTEPFIQNIPYQGLKDKTGKDGASTISVPSLESKT